MDIEMLLEQIELLLGISRPDDELVEKLTWILESSKSRLKLLLEGMEPPEELSYIVVEVSVIRFNRIGSEGVASHTVEGESLSFSDDDFAGYMGEIEAYLREQKTAKKGRVRFL